MSRGFNWFKSYEIYELDPDHWYSDYAVRYLNGDSTSHSCFNISLVQDLLETYGGKWIPYVNDEFIDSIDYRLDLIEPTEMSEMCDKVLAAIPEDHDMRERIEWFKKLSDEGYYLTYDSV